jgi:hypothetical protein
MVYRPATMKKILLCVAVAFAFPRMRSTGDIVVHDPSTRHFSRRPLLHLRHRQWHSRPDFRRRVDLASRRYADVRRVRWQARGRSAGARWKQHLAPDLIHVGDKYFLYYSRRHTRRSRRSVCSSAARWTRNLPTIAGKTVGRSCGRMASKTATPSIQACFSAPMGSCGSPTARTSDTSASSSWTRRPESAVTLTGRR